MHASHDLAWLNELAPADARTELLKCCGATRWAEAVEQGRPYDSVDQLIAKAIEVWWAPHFTRVGRFHYLLRRYHQRDLRI